MPGTDATQFAKDMMSDHSEASTVLSEAAKQGGIAMPGALDNKQKQTALKAP